MKTETFWEDMIDRALQMEEIVKLVEKKANSNQYDEVLCGYITQFHETLETQLKLLFEYCDTDQKKQLNDLLKTVAEQKEKLNIIKKQIHINK